MSFLKFLRREPETRRLILSIDFVTEPDGEAFHAYSPALPGLHADGSSHEDAARNFVAAIPAYIESLEKHGDPLPVGTIKLVRQTSDETPAVPTGAFLRHVQQVKVQWPSLHTSGIS